MASNEENQSFNNFSKSGQEDINRTITREKLIAEIEQDLKNNPRYKSFFDQYNPRSINYFIDYYKNRKASWIMWGDLYNNIEKKKILKYSTIANDKLWEIQQKKLFNLQCRWRAEEIELPGINLTYDFWYWELYIRQCPFISPISEDEYQLYCDYILSDDFELEDVPSYQWQSYEDFKAEYMDSKRVVTTPEWYQFYDSRMGTGGLLTLPDIRGDKEQFYFKLYFENEKKQNPEKYNIKTDPDTRPQLKYYDHEELEQFIETFEDTKIKDAYRAFKNNNLENLEHDGKLMDAIEVLKQDDNYELTFAGNWRDSIIKTAYNYEKQKVYAAFSTAYKNYLNRLNMGIDFDHELTQDTIDHINQLINLYKQKILKGRILNNEPADLNF